MKMYRETLRKLMPIGLPLALATLIYTIIVGGQNYFGAYTLSTPQSAIGLTPVLVYYVFSALLFALYGFSYQFKRAASDLYHSLPVSRTSLYLSVTLATATWMGGTILINVLLTLLMLLISGCPFVPAYIPLIIAFYFVAAMMVYAAAAIGCALSGTLVTALASTGVVLLLPRFIQFIFARGVAARVPIIGWLDMPALLSPVTNVATGLIVMHSRQVYMARIVALPAILYSLVPMALLLLLAAWLHNRRPSETAERGAGRKCWAVATASMLSLAALLLITIDNHRLISVYGAAVTAIAFLVFVVYQFVAARSVKQVALSMPFFLLSALVAFGLSLGIDAAAKAMLNTAPKPEEIASVTFRGHDEKSDAPEYTTLLLDDIAYTTDDMKKYVAETLADAVDRINDPYTYGYNVYSQQQVIEPILIRLHDGRSFKRTIEFKNVETLNALRAQDGFYQAAIRAFPTASAAQYRMVDYDFTAAQIDALWNSYTSESQKLGLISNDYYRKRSETLKDTGYNVERGGQQTMGRITTVGHVGTQRFSDNGAIRMETPQTASLLMGTYNTYAKPDTLTRLKQGVKHIVSPLAMENDSLSLDLNLFNLPVDEGEPVSWSVNIYISGYTRENDERYNLYCQYMTRFADILQRGTLTDDPTGLFLRLNWFEYDGTSAPVRSEPVCYIAFSDADEQALITLVQSWIADTAY
jgi:hypothetical protein